MVAWICGNPACGTRYSVGAERCPQCSANDPHEEGDETMAKASRLGGSSIYREDIGEAVRPVDGSPVGDDGGQTAADTEDLDDTFDPGAHSVAEVNAYLADVDPAEAQRVRDAETAGRNRRGILIT